MSIFRREFGTSASIENLLLEMIAPVLTSEVATRNWSVGEQYILDGTLYKVTQPVMSGSSFVVNTNCEVAPKLVEQISAIS